LDADRQPATVVARKRDEEGIGGDVAVIDGRDRAPPTVARRLEAQADDPWLPAAEALWHARPL
jgi:hypothetical protein